jgi:hypothetical protein
VHCSAQFIGPWPGSLLGKACDINFYFVFCGPAFGQGRQRVQYSEQGKHESRSLETLSGKRRYDTWLRCKVWQCMLGGVKGNAEGCGVGSKSSVRRWGEIVGVRSKMRFAVMLQGPGSIPGQAIAFAPWSFVSRGFNTVSNQDTRCDLLEICWV